MNSWMQTVSRKGQGPGPGVFFNPLNARRSVTKKAFHQNSLQVINSRSTSRRRRSTNELCHKALLEGQEVPQRERQVWKYEFPSGLHCTITSAKGQACLFEHTFSDTRGIHSKRTFVAFTWFWKVDISGTFTLNRQLGCRSWRVKPHKCPGFYIIKAAHISIR